MYLNLESAGACVYAGIGTGAAVESRNAREYTRRFTLRCSSPYDTFITSCYTSPSYAFHFFFFPPLSSLLSRKQHTNTCEHHQISSLLYNLIRFLDFTSGFFTPLGKLPADRITNVRMPSALMQKPAEPGETLSRRISRHATHARLLVLEF